MNTNTTYMNPNTGSVDTKENWIYDCGSEVNFDKEVSNNGLIEVVKNSEGDWVEA